MRWYIWKWWRLAWVGGGSIYRGVSNITDDDGLWLLAVSGLYVLRRRRRAHVSAF